MCGIAGIFDREGKATIDPAVLTRMKNSLVHRGPDAEGEFHEPGCGLAHRRLSIIDLSGGAQPLFNEDESVVVVYNGEIYNFQDLQSELQALGHSFRTSCDTEVVVHAWEQWGPQCVERFRGMFAFALLDRRQEVLFLARDRLGIKPLYYAELPSGQLLFGSELKALLAHPELDREIDPKAVEDYFAFGYVPDPKTIYKGIYKLPPAHYLLCPRHAETPRPRTYWHLRMPNGFAPEDEASLTDDLIARLREAVRIRLISDVPLGAFLSGGVDSSTVVALMAGLSNEAVNTCSIGFADQAFDESRFAQEVAQQFRTRHHMRRVETASYEHIDRLAEAYDEPFADSSAVPTYEVCEVARERVTVALSGDGGDEVFWGYTRYRWHDDEIRLRSRIPGLLRGRLTRYLADAWPLEASWPKATAAAQTLQAIARAPDESYFHTLRMIDEAERSKLFTADLRHALGDYRAFDTFKTHYDAAPSAHPVGKIQYADLMTYLPGDILTKVDRASMAHSLEVRVPMLDHHVVEWAHGLPPEHKMRNGEGKYVLKKAAERQLSKDLLYRRKMGFGVPLDAWFRGPLKQRAQDALLGERMIGTGFFETGRIATLLDQHREGRRNHGTLLWALLMFEAFLRRVHAAPAAS